MHKSKRKGLVWKFLAIWAIAFLLIGATQNIHKVYNFFQYIQSGYIYEHTAAAGIYIGDPANMIWINDGEIDGRDISVDGTNQDNHIASTANPHTVTQTQVGLSAVLNAIQLFADGSDLPSIAQGAIFYYNGTGWDYLPAGVSGKFLKTQGAGENPIWDTAATGDVTKVGTPVDNQIGVWTGDGTIEGTAGFTYDGSNFQITGDIGSTGTRITKGWFVDLQVTNAIAGDITGNAATVSTITTLAPDTATTQATQGNITTCSALTTIGTVTSGGLGTGSVIGTPTMTLGADADGDTYYRSSNILTRLAKGTAFQLKRMNAGATAPEWWTADYKTTRTGVYRTIYIDAGAMVPCTTNGAESGTNEYGTNDIDWDYFAFDDGATEERVQFKLVMPEAWNEGTIKVKLYWSSATGSTAGDTVEWGIKGGAISDNDAIDAALGGDQTISDTLLANNGDDLQVAGATGAFTISGVPAEADIITFEVYRNTDGTDDMEEDAWLFGVWIQYLESSTEPSAW